MPIGRRCIRAFEAVFQLLFNVTVRGASAFHSTGAGTSGAISEKVDGDEDTKKGEVDLGGREHCDENLVGFVSVTKQCGSQPEGGPGETNVEACYSAPEELLRLQLQLSPPAWVQGPQLPMTAEHDNTIDLDYGLRLREKMGFDALARPTRRRKNSTSAPSSPVALSLGVLPETDHDLEGQTSSLEMDNRAVQDGESSRTPHLFVRDPLFQISAQLELLHSLTAQRSNRHGEAASAANVPTSLSLLRLSTVRGVNLSSVGCSLQFIVKQKHSVADEEINGFAPPTAFLASQWLGQARSNLQHPRHAVSWRWRLFNRLRDAVHMCRALVQTHELIRCTYDSIKAALLDARVHLQQARARSATDACSAVDAASWSCSEREVRVVIFVVDLSVP